MTNDKDKTIRVGSRKSELALIQTKHVIARLQKLYPKKKFEIHTMTTIGDRVLNISLPKIGEKSLFTRDLEDALRNGGVDFVVHSLKDLPTALPTGMAIGAVLEREDERDALVLRENYKNFTLATLPKGSIIGTSSLRRTAQIRRQYPHLVVCDIRGNLNTRLAKLDAENSKFAGIILAQAGLVRMGWEKRISQVLDPTDLLYAVGQGALAVECRANDHEVLAMLRSLMCLSTTCRILAERSFLKTLGGGCSAPVAVWSKLDGNVLNLDVDSDTGLSLVGAVWSLDGETEIRDKKVCSFMVTNANTNGNKEENSNEPPDCKRRRSDESSSSGNGSDNSPPVINEDEEAEKLTAAYNMTELLEKHIDLAKKCPVFHTGARHIEFTNDDNSNAKLERGGGDADMSVHCPLKMDIGQDVMGQCPFVSDDVKVTLALDAKCPATGELKIASKDEIDLAAPSTSKCPFSSMHSKNGNDLTMNSVDGAHGKCPFLQKTVQTFDYTDEEKPLPKSIPKLIDDVENLFCGLYHHACFSRELYIKSNELGQQLAEELIKKGALDVMKCAQAEIHSKA